MLVAARLTKHSLLCGTKLSFNVLVLGPLRLGTCQFISMTLNTVPTKLRDCLHAARL